MAGRLAGKVALITGGASGLGAAMAARFVGEGARVVVTDIDAAGAARKAAELGDAAAACAHDVTSPDEWQAALAFAERTFGALHILVNNAGIGTGGTVESTSLDDWRRVHAVDLDSVFFGCKLALPLMAASCARDGRNGSILNISSIAGVIAAANMAAYNSAKAGVRHLSKSVALHCARREIPDHLQLDPPGVHRHADPRQPRRPGLTATPGWPSSRGRFHSAASASPTTSHGARCIWSATRRSS